MYAEGSAHGIRSDTGKSDKSHVKAEHIQKCLLEQGLNNKD